MKFFTAALLAFFSIFAFRGCGSPQAVAGMFIRDIGANIVANILMNDFKPPAMSIDDQYTLEQNITPSFNELLGDQGVSSLAGMAYQDASQSVDPATYISGVQMYCYEEETDDACARRDFAEKQDYANQLVNSAASQYKVQVLSNAQQRIESLNTAFEDCTDEVNNNSGQFQSYLDMIEYKIQCLKLKGFDLESNVLVGANSHAF